MNDTMLSSFIGVLVVLAIVFLLLRAVVLWYWKISKIVENQEALLFQVKRSNELLQQIQEQGEQKTTSS